MLGHWASTQTVLSLSSPSDSRSRAYLSPCAARCRSHAGFFTSGSLPVYGPVVLAVRTGGAASAWHRTTDTEPCGSLWTQLSPLPDHTGGRSGRTSELCIMARRNRGAGLRGFVGSSRGGRRRWVRRKGRLVFLFYPGMSAQIHRGRLSRPGWYGYFWSPGDDTKVWPVVQLALLVVWEKLSILMLLTRNRVV